MKRRSDEALSDLCETCEHYHACGTTCEECGHVRGGETTTTMTTNVGGGVGMTGGNGMHSRANERPVCVEVIERFLVIGAFEHTANERALVASGVRTVINAVPTCPPCCSGRYLSVITLSTVEQREESEDRGQGASKKHIDCGTVASGSKDCTLGRCRQMRRIRCVFWCIVCLEDRERRPSRWRT